MKWTKLGGALLAAAGMMGTAFAGTCAPLSTELLGAKQGPAFLGGGNWTVLPRKLSAEAIGVPLSDTQLSLQRADFAFEFDPGVFLGPQLGFEHLEIAAGTAAAGKEPPTQP